MYKKATVHSELCETSLQIKSCGVDFENGTYRDLVRFFVQVSFLPVGPISLPLTGCNVIALVALNTSIKRK